MPEYIDAVQKLIPQDVTYDVSEATLGFSFTSIHDIEHDHLTKKKFVKSSKRCLW